jgi:predicted ferric reductase
LALLNLVLVIFLALKNTPLALLTANSYESLNQLHQACGYTTALCATLHATFQSIAWTRRIKYPGFIVDTQQKFGMVALACFWIIVISALTIRRFKYEVFYVIHLTMIVLALVSIGIHRNSSVNKAIIVTIIAAGIWGIDGGFRTLRTLSNSKGTTATIYPLPNRATRVVLDRSLSSAVPGTHCYLWIPKIRLLETHPFTIISNITTSSSSSLEFVIAAHDGFTSDLYEYASKNPGTSLRASMDGPYGIPANFGTVADKVVFLSGGSGASYTFGVALDMIKKIPISGITGPSIDFVWTVGEAGQFT